MNNIILKEYQSYGGGTLHTITVLELGVPEQCFHLEFEFCSADFL